MSYNPGKMRLIDEWLTDEPTQNGKRWYKKALLSCGHIVAVPIGNSPTHKLRNGQYTRLSTRCLECFKKENNI